MRDNQFEKLFHEDMSSNEARGLFFDMYSMCSAEDIELLKKAYYPILHKIINKELDYCFKTGCMMSNA